MQAAPTPAQLWLLSRPTMVAASATACSPLSSHSRNSWWRKPQLQQQQPQQLPADGVTDNLQVVQQAEEGVAVVVDMMGADAKDEGAGHTAPPGQQQPDRGLDTSLLSDSEQRCAPAVDDQIAAESRLSSQPGRAATAPSSRKTPIVS